MSGILFLGVTDAARAPMAEAIARHLAPERSIWSAGARPTHVRPEVREVLREVDIGVQGLRSRGIFEVPMDEIALVVTLADPASCPQAPKRLPRVAWMLTDPAAAPREEALEAFRATRDELMRRLPALLRSLNASDGPGQ